MSEQPESVTEFEPEPESRGTTTSAGRSIDDGKGRVFPCPQCGAELTFNIGQQSLKCDYCSHVVQIEIPADAAMIEHDLTAMLAQLESKHDGDEADLETTGEHEIRCSGCGANVVFNGALTTTRCPYCGEVLQRDKVHDATSRIKVDGVIPFQVPEAVAAENIRHWVQNLWFAPNQFKAMGVKGKFKGVYLPFFTFDAMTFTRYRGQRGDDYWVEVPTQNNQTTRELRTRWTPAGGQFTRFFDDVLVMSVRKGVNPELTQQLEPWPLESCMPYKNECLSGFFACTYDVPLKDCFAHAQDRIKGTLHNDACQRIGGNRQQIDALQVQYSALTYKHLLLPVWLLAYRFNDRTFQVLVNAVTGEVQGERPWSWIKITCAIVAALALFGTVMAISQR